MTTFKLMPVEATGEMRKAGVAAIRLFEESVLPGEPRFPALGIAKVWPAMCEAAPSPWRPIEEAPERGNFYVWRPSTESIIAVFLAGGSAPRKENARLVIEPMSGKNWFATHFIPLDALGIPGGEGE